MITGNVTTGVGSGTVNLTSNAGAVTGSGKVLSGGLMVSAVTGINLGTQVGTLDATNKTSDGITLNQSGALVAHNVSAMGQSIKITAGGTIDVTGVLTTATTSGATTGAILLTSAGGKMYTDAANTNRITTQTLTATASTGINLNTDVAALNAQTTGAGDILIDEASGVSLSSISAANGLVRVIAGGDITVGNVRSLTDAAGKNVLIVAKSGDINVDYVEAGRNKAEVSLSSLAGNIRELNVAPSPDAAVDVKAKTVILYAKGEIGSSSNKALNLEIDAGTLYQMAGGVWTLTNITGDIELCMVVDKDITLNATGNITVTYLDSTNHNINLTSAKGTITASEIYAGTGNLTLWAQNGSATIAGSSTDKIVATGKDVSIGGQTGPVSITGSIVASGKADLECGGSKMTLNGNLTAASSVKINAFGPTSLEINGNVKSTTSWIDLQCGGTVFKAAGSLTSKLQTTINVFNSAALFTLSSFIDSGSYIDIEYSGNSINIDYPAGQTDLTVPLFHSTTYTKIFAHSAGGKIGGKITAGTNIEITTHYATVSAVLSAGGTIIVKNS